MCLTLSFITSYVRAVIVLQLGVDVVANLTSIYVRSSKLSTLHSLTGLLMRLSLEGLQDGCLSPTECCYI